MMITDQMIDDAAQAHNPFAFEKDDDDNYFWPSEARDEARWDVRKILSVVFGSAALDGPVVAAAWRFDVEDAPKDRPYMVAMIDGEDIEYHVAKAVGVGKATIIIGGAFGFDRSGKVFAWREIDPVAPPVTRKEHPSQGARG